MARKYQLITELYQTTLKEITATQRIWRDFLRSGCYNYKCRFDEQVLIYAQRPDAKAVLEIERWNKLFGRWVNRGAAGIAVFDDSHNGRARLKHYFDISDTHPGWFSRTVPIWRMQERYEDEVIEALENSFGSLEDKDSLDAVLLKVVSNVVEDNYQDYYQELLACRDDSFLEELDDRNVKVFFQSALESSVSYMLLKRCIGDSINKYEQDMDFSAVSSFNTRETATALGIATSDMAEMVLKEVARTIRDIEKRERNGDRTFDDFTQSEYPISKQKEDHSERSFEYGTDIQPAGRLQSAEPTAAPRVGDSPWEIRIDAPDVSERESQSDLHESADIRETEQSSDGDRADSTDQISTVDGADGEKRGADRGTQSQRPDEMGGIAEQYPAGSGGTDTGGIDLQLNEEQTDAGGEELPAFLDEKLISEIIANKDDDLMFKKSQIELFFSLHQDEGERAQYLKSAYHDRYTEILAGDQRVGYRPQEDGLLMWKGAYPSRSEESLFSWGVVVELTGQLINQKEYFVNTNIKKLKSQSGQQMSLFDYGDFSDQRSVPDGQFSLVRNLGISQQVIDEALCLGGNEPKCLERITAYFAKDYPLEQNAGFLQKEYGRDGKGFYSGEQPISMWFDEKGIRIAKGKTAEGNQATVLTWEECAKRIRELLDMGRYVPKSVLDHAAINERQDIAASLWYTVQDFSDEARAENLLPTVLEIYQGRGGFPDNTAKIEELLEDSEKVNILIRELDDFIKAYGNKRDLLRFHFHRPKKLAEQLRGLQREQIAFAVPEEFFDEPKQFITEDEIDKLLIGGGNIQHTKFRIYSYFSEEHTPKERADFLKAEYGTGGSGRSGFHTNHDSKGIEYSRGDIFHPYNKVLLRWNQVQKRISEQISHNRYMTEKELAYIPTYERNELARQIYSFFYDVPQEQPHPYPYGFDHYDAIPLIEEQLGDPAKVEAVYQMMVPVWENTTQEDRYYKSRQKAFDNLTAYRNGTFSLFGEKKQSVPPIAIAEKPPEEVIPAPPRQRKERIYFTDLHPEIPEDQRHDFSVTDPELGNGTPSEKFAANMAAIRTLKQIEDEERLATPEEQVILSRYVGWGGLASCFEETHVGNPELKNRLTAEEYAATRESTLTAFYTSPVIIGAMYQALEQMGFQTGNILEPSCGVGNFIGMIPDSMAESKAYGVEIDSISGRIARQLYQNSSIIVEGYEKVDIPDSFFDVAIGNVPFGDFKVLDRRYDKNKWLIHDYFFGKTLDKVRPGGIIAFITSKGTMDKENASVRKYLAQRADLIGAIRLPNNAFKRNAGTEVTSDIICLQKRDRLMDIEPDWVYLDTDEKGIKMNRYFVEHPDMILGEMVMESTRFGMDSTCKAYEGESLSEQLKEAVSNLHAEINEYEMDELEEEEDLSIPADPEVRNFSYTIQDGKIYFRENSRMHPVEMSVTAENRIRGMIALRDCVRTLIQYQSEDYLDDMIQAEQGKLNQIYGDYTKKYGLLCSRGNSLAFGEDSSYALLCSLEVLDDEGNFKRKADMFSKRTIKPHVAVTSVDTASEALAVSISEKARVDMEYMSKLSGKTEHELAAELTGVIFRDIICPTDPSDISDIAFDLTRYPFVSADEYLSGNVRKKLQIIKAIEQALPSEKKNQIHVNLTALEAVQPTDLTASEIGVRIGATWVPPEIYRQFMFELIDTGNNGRRRMNILYSKFTGEWNISDKNSDFGNIKAVTTYGTKRISAYYILEQTLNLKDVRIFDTIIENGNEKRVLNKKETAIAQDRQELIKVKFTEWLWKDIDRREMLCKIYNETFNSIRPREYDGQHITFNGMNPEIILRKHQINAIAHVMYGGNTLLAHQVGAGKTYEMVAAAMESKRLGLCSKSLVVVPNHITEQWAAEWLQLYPAANILVATKKDFETKNRKKFCARIATGEYDAIIIGHSQFEKIPMSKERQEIILKRQIDELVFGIQEAKSAHAERYTIKQMEKTKKSLVNRLAKLNDQARKDNVVTFEELGVDRIFIDESHYFKNLFLMTKMRNVGGIAQTEAQKSSDLFMKTQYLNEITGNKGVIFATGTPISNSMVELYTIQRYLQYSTLQESGMQHFDEWAANFGETVTAIELAPEGTGYRAKTRFAKFYNLPELMATFKAVADIQTADMLKLPVPKANFHTEVIKPSELQKEMVATLAKRAEEIRGGSVDPKEDNMLKITNDGRKLALDMRLINPLAPDDENGKVAVCARNIYRIWDASSNDRSAQLVFCDLSTPGKNTPIEMKEVSPDVYEMIPGQFKNVYDDLKRKLIEKGIPETEIAFIHDANTEVRKKELFAKVRSGQVRILMGSTQKMGAGTNVQDRLIALHDLDCPWRPSDLEQRLGRIVRQGNSNPAVEIYRYVTEGTFDSYLYQLVENKQKFISQIMTSKAPLRIAEDVDESALSYAEIKALATGNPMIIEKCNLDMEVGKLNMLKTNHLSQRYALEEMVLRKYPESITRLSERADGYGQDVQLAAAYPKLPDTFPGMEIFGIKHTEKETAGKAILDACTKMTGSDAVYLGQYRGFSMTLAYDSNSNEYRLTLKGTLSHTVVLGADVHGNLTRADNVLEGLDGKLGAVKEELANTKVQLENARTEMETPFAKETELEEKTIRLKELNILLNMDEKDRSVMDTEQENEGGQSAPKVKDRER